jgi:CBS domain containing-hemolysin-like protein
VAGLNLGAMVALGFAILALHLVSVTLAKALRTYSRTRLEEVCAEGGHPDRADDVTHHDERTERSAEALAVVTGLLLAALLGAIAGRLAPQLATRLVVAIALGLGGLGYVLAGIVGRVFAETVIDTLWPAAGALRLVTGPLTFGSRQAERLVEHLAHPRDGHPRPASVEVEIPADGEDPEDIEAELPESARELLQRAVELTRRDVAEIMTPRSAMVTLPSTVNARAAGRTFRESGRSRVPLFGENRDDIVGILYAKDFFPRVAEEGLDAVAPRKLVRPAHCVPDTKNAYALLEEFRQRRTHIAIVLDEYGGVAGLITLEDLLEELVGAIDDEHDVPTPSDPVVSLGGTRYEVDGTLSLEELNDRLNLHFPTDGDFLTVGGLAFHALGRLPQPGEGFRQDGVEFTVLEVAEHSIRRLRLDLQPAEAVGS